MLVYYMLVYYTQVRQRRGRGDCGALVDYTLTFEAAVTRVTNFEVYYTLTYTGASGTCRQKPRLGLWAPRYVCVCVCVCVCACVCN